jgi:hypothetical protein
MEEVIIKKSPFIPLFQRGRQQLTHTLTRRPYLLGLLNSSLMFFLFRSLLPKLRGDFYEPSYVFFKNFPIRTINFNNPTEKATHDKLVSLVDLMLELHKKQNSIPPSAEREKVEREIAVTDEKIDEIVYGLYGVTEGERKIIEEK